MVLLAPAYNRAASAGPPPQVPADGAAMTAQSHDEFTANWAGQTGCSDQVDPAASDFGQRVSDAITAAVETNPGWKLTAPAAAPAAPASPAVPRSGTGPVTGVPDGPRQFTEADVARMSPSEVQKAMDDGLLQGLGFGTARKRRR